MAGSKIPNLSWRKSVPAATKSPMAMAGSGSLMLRIAATGIGFLQSVLAARLLGVHGYGVFAFASAVVSIAATLALLGMDLLAVRELARLKALAAWEKAAGFFRTSTIAVLGASILAGATISGFALLMPGLEYHRELALAGLIIPPASMILLFQAQCRGLGVVVRGQVPSSLIRPAIMMTAFAALYFGAVHINAFDAILIFFLASLVALAFAATIAYRALPEHPANESTTSATHKHLRQAAPFLTMSILGILLARANTLLLVWLSGPDQAGLFQPIALLASVMVIGLDTIAMPMAPRIAHLWEVDDIARLKRTLHMATLAATGIAISVISAILLFAPFILGAFGKEFVAPKSALIWIALAQLFNAATGNVGILLSMTAHHRDTLKCQIIQLAANLALGIVLIPGLGAKGAAISLAAGYVIFNGCALIFARMRLGFDPSLLHLIQTYRSKNRRPQ